MIRIQSSSSQSGMGLFEILIILGAVSVSLMGIFQVIKERQIHNQTQQAVQMLKYLAKEAVSYNKIHSNYADLNCNNLDENCYFVQKNILPQNAQTPFGSAIEVASPNIGQNFKLSFQNIPMHACATLLLSLNDIASLQKVELFNPDQVSITSNEQVLGPDGQPLGFCPPQQTNTQETSANTELRQTQAGTTTNGIRVPEGSGVCIADTGFNVLSLNTFPMTGLDVVTACSNFPRMTIAWTFN